MLDKGFYLKGSRAMQLCSLTCWRRAAMDPSFSPTVFQFSVQTPPVLHIACAE